MSANRKSISMTSPLTEHDQPPGPHEPAWKRAAAIDGDGVVYVPALLSGDKPACLHCAACDRVKMVRAAGHLFVPARWMAWNYLDVADRCIRLERALKAHVAKEGR